MCADARALAAWLAACGPATIGSAPPDGAVEGREPASREDPLGDCTVRVGDDCVDGDFSWTARGAPEACQLWEGAWPARARPVFMAGRDECDPGSLSPDAEGEAVRRTTLVRRLASLEPVEIDAARAAGAQACARTLSAMDALTGEVPPDAPCFSDAAAEAAAASNLARDVASPADAIALFLEDPGVDSLGHRRWLLYPALSRTGFGFYQGFACMWVMDDAPGAPDGPPLVAWPGPGFQPRGAVHGAWSLSAASGLAAACDDEVCPVEVRDESGRAVATEGRLTDDGYGLETIAFDVPVPEQGGDFVVWLPGTRVGRMTRDVAYRVSIRVCDAVKDEPPPAGPDGGLVPGR